MFSSNSPGRRAAEPDAAPVGTATSAKHTQVAGHRWARLPASAAASRSWVQKGSVALAVTGMVSGAVFSQMHIGASDDWVKAADVTDAPTAAETASVDFSGAELSSKAGAGATESTAKHRATDTARSGSLEELSHGSADAGSQNLQTPQHDAKAPTGKHRAEAPGAGAAPEQKSGGDAAESSAATPQEQVTEPADSPTANGEAAAGPMTAPTDEAAPVPTKPSDSPTTSSATESSATTHPTHTAADEPNEVSDLLDIGLKLPLPSLELH